MCATYHRFFAFPSSCLVFPRGIRNFLAISYSHNFCKTCHFQVAWPPAILFSAILVFSLTSTIEGREAMQLENDKFCGNCASS